jgi:hypothetical protein
MKPLFPINPGRMRTLASAVIGLFFIGGAHPCVAQGADATTAASAPVELPPGAQDVVKLTQAGLSEDVIVAQVRSAGFIYRLTADQIIALTNAGVSQNVIKALIAPVAVAAPAAPDTPAASIPSTPETASLSSAPAVPSNPSAPSAPSAPPDLSVDESGPGTPPMAPTTPVSFDYFQSQLSPYGMWIQVQGYGWAWVPSDAVGNPFWQPYADQGQWVYTDLGWYWKSAYPWGGIAFHYGRWVRMERYGWAWIPDYTWGPAWVCWRHDEADGYCGWAPLPPAARFVPGIGLDFHGRLALDIDFGLGWNDFVFCSYDHLFDRDFHAYLLPRARVFAIYSHSIVRNNYAIVNGRFAVEGLDRARMEVLTHHILAPVVVRAAPVRDDRARAYPQPRDPYGRTDGRPGVYPPGVRPGDRPPETRYAPARASESPGNRTYAPPPDRRSAPPAKEAEPAKQPNPPAADSDQKNKQTS